MGLRQRLLPYTRLAKLEFFDFYLSILIVWSLLPATQRLSGDSLLVLALFLLGEVGVVVTVVVFDDITGYLDGSDQANYLGEDSGMRKLQRKPLLTGELTVAQARRFGLLALGWGVLLWTATIFVSPHRPMWAVVLVTATIVASVQYSWGAKLSYRGFGELLIAGAPTAIVLAPYALATGDLTGLVLTQALLFGLWQILVSAYSNTNDVGGDASVGRSTVAVLAGRRGNLLFIGCLTALDLGLIVGSALLHMAPWWFPLALLPVVVLRLRQFGGFARGGDALRARRRGVNVHRVGVAVLVLVNVVHLAQ
ncbi:MAG TPA: UbiA family prenyltransferase [Planosporangium sp.]|nr:UbiA family prenyltransferase [Planosporangium sp.]